MILPRILRPVASDLVEAANRYDVDGYAGLGDRFEKEFYSAVDRLSYSSTSHPKIYGEYRRIWLRPFPYALYYRIDGVTPIVALLVYGGRDPRQIQRLLRLRTT